MSCSSDGTLPHESVSVTDSAGVEIIRNVSSVDAIPPIRVSEPVISIGQEEGPESQLLYRVGGAVRLPDGLVVLADNGSSSVRFYDRTGTLVASFGSRGEGPREFIGVLGPWKVEADEARLAAYDFRGQRVTTLTRGGDFVDVIPLQPPSANPPRVAGVLDDLTVVQVESAWTGEPGELSQVTAHVVAFAPPEWARDTMYSAPSNHRGFVTSESGRTVMASPIFDSSFSAATGDTLIVVTDCASPEYRLIDPHGRIMRIVRWATGDRRVTEEEVALFYDAMTSGLPPERLRAMDEMLEVSPVRDVFPACDRPRPLLGGAVRVGVDGDVWVRDYIRPSDTHHVWLRFRDGAFRGRLSLDENVTVQEFGSDYVLVVERDDLGVERVREYPIPEDAFSLGEPTT